MSWLEIHNDENRIAAFQPHNRLIFYFFPGIGGKIRLRTPGKY